MHSRFLSKIIPGHLTNLTMEFLQGRAQIPTTAICVSAIGRSSTHFLEKFLELALPQGLPTGTIFLVGEVSVW